MDTHGEIIMYQTEDGLSHKQAINKAKAEYRKYQKITLTPVEQAYLESIKDVEKEVAKKK